MIDYGISITLLAGVGVGIILKSWLFKTPCARSTSVEAMKNASIQDCLQNFIERRLKLLGSQALIGNEEEAQFIRTAFDAGLLSGSSIRTSASEALCRIGRDMFVLCTEKGLCLDHEIPSPEALAYVIRHKILMPEQVALIRFDDEPLEEYVRQADGLLEKVVEQLCAGTACLPSISILPDADIDCLCYY